MKLWVKNTILAVILVLIIAVPLLQEWAPVLSALYLAE